MSWHVKMICFYRLCDSDVHVRQSAVTVLTHLILNDMVKVKGQLSEMALCLQDPIPKISDRVKLFFLELSRKVKNYCHEVAYMYITTLYMYVHLFIFIMYIVII